MQEGNVLSERLVNSIEDVLYDCRDFVKLRAVSNGDDILLAKLATVLCSLEAYKREKYNDSSRTDT